MRGLRGRFVVAAVCGVSAMAMCAAQAAPGAPGRRPAAASTTPATVTVRADQSLGSTNSGLRGFVWNTGPVDGVIPLEPTGIRIDGSLQSASRGPDDLDLSGLLTKVSEVRRTGAEPLVILSYMPRWLANSLPNDPRDPTRLAPRDMDAWQHLVEQVVQTLATAPSPARRFEVWNEPNLPVFWQDTPAAFLQMAIRTHAGVAAVAARTGLHLEVGGPASVFPDPSSIAAYRTATTAAGFPPDFISWHWYFTIGQDGNEGQIPDEAYDLVRGHDNPFNTPAAIGPQVALVRNLVGGGPKLLIDEWNVAAGGYDHRHDTHEAAAYQAGALTEMERAGLDGAYLYRAQDSPSDKGRIGDWGVVDATGTPKPGWWVFDAWRRTEGTRVATAGDDPLHGFWARATRAAGRVDVILSSFSLLTPADRTVTVHVDGFHARCAVVQTIDSPDDTFAGARPAPVRGDLTVSVPSPAVVWMRLLDNCASPTR